MATIETNLVGENMKASENDLCRSYNTWKKIMRERKPSQSRNKRNFLKKRIALEASHYNRPRVPKKVRYEKEGSKTLFKNICRQ